jgi:O-methyltransferase
MTTAVSLYLDLLKNCITNSIYGQDIGQEGAPVPLEGIVAPDALHAMETHGYRLALVKPFDPAARAEGRDWPPVAHTMVGIKRLDNLQFCIEDVLRRKVPGDLMETGVWRGGACIFMRGALKAYGERDRCVWVADSFDGVPPPDEDNYPPDCGDQLHKFRILAVTEEQVRANFARYGLLDEQVRFLKGRFRDTLPNAPVSRLAVLRLDGDLYESTMDALSNLYPRLSTGGYLIVDDYGCLPACRQAVDAYREAHGVTEEIIPIDWTGVYWQRSGRS